MRETAKNIFLESEDTYLITTFERQKDILKIISNLDISPTMHRNATEKYKALAAFLEDCGIEADIYPQGSFALGTVIRPAYRDPDANYDLDFICELHMTRDDITPSELRKKIEEALTSSDRYSGKVKVWKECFTIEYADVNGVRFSIDIVPAINEGIQQKRELSQLSQRPDLIETAIAIPRHNGERNYNWLTNNPHGLKKWFDEINTPFLQYGASERLAAYFQENRAVFNSVEEIPTELDRSAMQRVIQLLKYHRDNYYHNLPRKDSDDLKPISAIITVLVADIAKGSAATSDVFELLAYVLCELKIYAQQQTMRFDEFQRTYSARSSITRKNGIWTIVNPANPKDNLANKWNDNAEISRFFFKWIQACYNDLVESLTLPDNQFRTQLENAFGSATVKNNWGAKYSNVSAPKPIITASASKPYRAL